jgi:DNA-binding Xre family transcriptional regulator
MQKIANALEVKIEDLLKISKDENKH